MRFNAHIHVHIRCIVDYILLFNISSYISCIYTKINMIPNKKDMHLTYYKY